MDSIRSVQGQKQILGKRPEKRHVFMASITSTVEIEEQTTQTHNERMLFSSVKDLDEDKI